MPIDRAHSGIAFSVAVLLAACAGNGEGLDQNGNPIGSGGSSSGAITADLQSIEDHVFTPICSKCHVGASAPEGLELDADHAYQDLVGVQSSEEQGVLRVKPGDPDASYLVQKIEGAPGIEGSQMPLGETPLPAATIAAIRQWIANGAPNVSAGAAMSQVFELRSTSPAHGATVAPPVRQIVIAFTHELDATLVNDTTVRLERVTSPDAARAASRDDAGADEPALRIAVSLMLNRHNPATLIVRPLEPLEPGRYRLRLRGTGGAALADLGASTLQGDRTIVFTVVGAP
jgi:hypothetical protein